MIQTKYQLNLPLVGYYFEMTCGERLKLAMEERGVDRKTLAASMGVTVHTLGMVITGGGGDERWLSRENNASAAKHLRVNAHWLATGEGDMIPQGISAKAVLSPVDNAPAAIKEVADPLAILRSILNEVPQEYRKDALLDAIHGMAAWITPDIALAKREQRKIDAAGMPSDAPRNDPAKRKTPAP
jgi:transcriptional regulator with XRE-family HTH domain